MARRPPLPDALVGLLVFLVAEAMLFAALVSAYLIFKAGSPAWPPTDLPRLPFGVTAANTAGLVGSALAMGLALSSLRSGRPRRFLAGLSVATLLGATFLVVQGLEWARLLRAGLTVRSGVFGGAFYALVGLHALHVLGAVVWLAEVLRRAAMGRYGPGRMLGPALCGVYWAFVVVVWLGIFVLVYLPLR